MVNHDVAHSKRRAKLAALSAVAIAESSAKTVFPKASLEQIIKICVRDGLCDTNEIVGKIIEPNKDYWQEFNLFTSLTRKIGIGDHPYR